MRQMLEREIEKMVGTEVKRHGCMWVKITSPGLAGIPDRLLICPTGEMIWVELKTEHGRLGEHQKACIARLRRHNCRVMVVRGESGAAGLLKMIRRRFPGAGDEIGRDPDEV